MKKLNLLIDSIKKVANLIYKYRYYIAIIFFILCVIFEISGSSIAYFKEVGMSDVENDGVLLGKARGIRSDEYAVLTPMSFSQKFDGFKYFSDLARGGSTDVFIVYGLPTMNLMQIFRPFQIGFLFLGLAKGLSFFWYGRSIALFLVMIELFMLITNRNKLLSVVGAIMITLAPLMQWWFAVNGIAEIFIFGGLAIVLLDKYMKTNNFKKRCLYLLGMVISAGGYLLVFYPPWQISMAYVFLMLGIWVICKNIKICKIQRKDVISIIVAIGIFLACMGYIFTKSFETIKIVMNTVYPGKRQIEGGTLGLRYFDYIINIFIPFVDGNGAYIMTAMFGVFPIGIILSIIVLAKNRKKDLLLILLLVVYLILTIWFVVGLPKIIASITLLNKVQPTRGIIATGSLDVMILLRCLAIMKKPEKRIPAIIISIITTITVVLLAKNNNKEYINMQMGIIMGIICLYFFYLALRYKAKYVKYLFTIGMVALMLITGMAVNPIQKGVDVIYESSLIKEVQKINSEDKGKWITEGEIFIFQNFVLAAGVPVINATNTYPNLQRWNSIDENKKYEEIYNRYAHIQVQIIKENSEVQDKFELIALDSFKVCMTPEDLEKLDVKYVISTNNNLEQFNKDNCKFEKISTVNEKYYIYKSNYNT